MSVRSKGVWLRTVAAASSRTTGASPVRVAVSARVPETNAGGEKVPKGVSTGASLYDAYAPGGTTTLPTVRKSSVRLQRTVVVVKVSSSCGARRASRRRRRSG